MNYCRTCNQDFGSVSAFDAHRIGKHAYTFREGLDLGMEDGRRCLDTGELAAAGWNQDTNGRWRQPSRTQWLSQIHANTERRADAKHDPQTT